jgi:phage FluMu protein Com
MKTERFIYSTIPSSCCKAEALLVRSRDGGFVSRNCLQCGEPEWVTLDGLPTLQCEFCGEVLEVTVEDQNYYYKCGKCNRSWELASVRGRPV